MRGKSFVTIMLIIAASALILRVAVEKIIKVSMAQNDANASLTLKLFSAALENYAKDNQGVYPVSLDMLSEATPAYLEKDYILSSSLKGYNFNCPRLEASGYNCVAIPLRCGLTGRMVYGVITGGSLISDECDKKEKE